MTRSPTAPRHSLWTLKEDTHWVLLTLPLCLSQSCGRLSGWWRWRWEGRGTRSDNWELYLFCFSPLTILKLFQTKVLPCDCGFIYKWVHLPIQIFQASHDPRVKLVHNLGERKHHDQDLASHPQTQHQPQPNPCLLWVLWTDTWVSSFFQNSFANSWLTVIE